MFSDTLFIVSASVKIYHFIYHFLILVWLGKLVFHKIVSAGTRIKIKLRILNSLAINENSHFFIIIFWRTGMVSEPGKHSSSRIKLKKITSKKN